MGRSLSASNGLTVEIVAPAHNEADYLESCIVGLCGLADSLPFETRVTVVDSGSTDDTWDVARRLADSHGINVLRALRPGRGRAIRAAWESSDADVLAYTDVDLSGDIASLPLMLDLVASGRADLAVGSRILEGERVHRRWSRTAMSRVYAEMVQWMAAPPFFDLQCGLKVVNAEVARDLLDKVESEDWFFDTELLLAAWQSGYQVVEVPIDWRERVRTTVKYSSTIAEDLAGLARLSARQLRSSDPDAARHGRRDVSMVSRVATHELAQTALLVMISWPTLVRGADRAAPRHRRLLPGALAAAVGLRSLAQPGRRAAVPISDLVFVGLALCMSRLPAPARKVLVAFRAGAGAARMVLITVWAVSSPADSAPAPARACPAWSGSPRGPST